MKTGNTIEEKNLPIGIWRKTHKVPKPVGVPLWIRKNGEIFEDVHSGPTTFKTNGLILQNTVYSYDLTEEWFDTCHYWPLTERGRYICTKEKPMPQELRKLGTWEHDDAVETDYDCPHYIEYVCKSCGHIWKIEMPD